MHHVPTTLFPEKVHLAAKVDAQSWPSGLFQGFGAILLRTRRTSIGGDIQVGRYTLWDWYGSFVGDYKTTCKLPFCSGL